MSVFVGALVQGAVGFGLALVAAPVVMILDPGLMPGSLQLVSAVLPLFTLAKEWRHVDWRGISWALLGRLPGMLAGLWILKTAPRDALGVGVGLMVLVAVGLTAWSVSLPRTPRTLAAAGLVSGFTGQATSIGGPPMGLVYQHARGPQIRATLAMYFAVGALGSTALNAVGGEMPARAALAGLALVPFLVAGFLASGPLRRYLDGGRIRAGVLAVAALSALMLIIQSILG
ncbi:sulfite exporter TauE/SafE family protein [Planomonospora alba]|uniref:Probable membrane transporter protein n=1 Tax=Planomonospora alba TaxID=161354 RepID=A0ABP6MZQ6_9ACTN